jgi:AsmA family protein
MREAFAELAGIDMVRGLGLLLGKDDKSTAIRCGIVAFQLKDGDAQAQRLVLDTTNVLVTGDGHINLNDEKLDLNLKGHPKKVRFGRLRSPINIRGTLRHPSVSLSTPAVVKQGALAAGLAFIGTPIAAALAFIDPGLAKDADCAGLFNETEDKVQRPPAPDSATK